MTTWNGASPPVLPQLSRSGRIIGFLRVLAFLVITMVALAVFIVGRALSALLGRWVTFHFLTARLWSRAGLWFLGLRLVVRGMPIASGALVSNHCSWADILTLRAVKLMYFVAKSEVREWPVVGLIATVTDTVFIERKRAHAKQQERALRQRIAANQLLIFFPEATSTDGLRVLPFKSSLFSAFFYDHHAADLWIQPVTIRYVPASRSGLPPDFYGWWGDMGLGSHIWTVMSRSFRGRAEITFHDPIRPQAFSDRKALAEHCGTISASGLNTDWPDN